MNRAVHNRVLRRFHRSALSSAVTGFGGIFDPKPVKLASVFDLVDGLDFDPPHPSVQLHEELRRVFQDAARVLHTEMREEQRAKLVENGVRPLVSP